jgi:GH25 family lysozyme M1 (1,4-beta-N-acetylmuramidase)
VARPLVFGVLTIALAVTFAPPSASAGSVYLEGVDASHHNGTPDWAAAKADGVRFAIVKATEGQTFVDNQYTMNRASADSLGLPFTAYHFARPDSTANDAVLEANHFLDTAGLRRHHLLPVLDLESTGGLGPRALRRWVKAWLARVEQRLGVKAIIYTSPSFWVERMGNSRWFADNGYRLWVAHWGVSRPTVPAQNWGGRGWTLWQYSSCGSVEGFRGCVDLDRYAGTGIAPIRIKNNR